MMKYVSEDFVQIRGDFTEDKPDFYGEYSPLDAQGQKKYLAEYYRYACKRYGADAVYTKAVPPETAEQVADSLAISHSPLVWNAYKERRTFDCQGWMLYTDRASVHDRTVTLADNHQFPVPCAKFEYGTAIEKLCFDVKIGKGYNRKVHEGILPTVTGRFIEFRRGCREIIKLMFSPDGTFCFKDGRNRPYHYTVHELGQYRFDSWNRVEMQFGKETFTVVFGGKSHTFAYTVPLCPDNIFIGGGMQPVDTWEVRFDRCITQNGDNMDLFVPNTDSDPCREEIGEVLLPYVIGTQQDKDKQLILHKAYTYDGKKKIHLRCDCLDPGGEVLVNGALVCHRDTFDRFTAEITSFLHIGENEIKVVVFPRAPEVLYPWHRHNDYYNGWFAGRIDLLEEDGLSLSAITVKTVFAKNDEAEFDIAFDCPEQVKYTSCRVSVQETYPCMGEETVVFSCNRTEQLRGISVKPIHLWNTDAPHLYNVTLTLFNGVEEVGHITANTGFRTIEQKNGNIYLNGEKIVLKGALTMQFLPPYENIPLNHVCPSDGEIVRQAMEIKAMNGNCLRLHQLGYGTNDTRFAEVCDKLGVLLIWTTRYIDAVENMMWSDCWYAKEAFQRQMLAVVNHPSIIIWEGSNELHTDLCHGDRVCDAFVDAVKQVDTTRLISPVSHIYYGGGIYECGCKYYNTDGQYDESGNAVKSSHGWLDRQVIRTAHTYCLLLGYGTSWRDMATQNWRWQEELFHEPQKAYAVTEYAVIGRQNPDTPEAKIFLNRDSYELGDEDAALGFRFDDGEWQLSQAFQALCAGVATRRLLQHGADGMLWCCLSSGANNASYLKPILDFYGYKKLAFYALQEAFSPIVAFNSQPDVLLTKGYTLTPSVFGLKAGEKYSLTVELLQGDVTLFSHTEAVSADSDKCVTAEPIALPEVSDGYYAVRYTVEQSDSGGNAK